MPGPDEKDKVMTDPDDLAGNFVILDANALLSPFQQNFNLDLQLEIAAPGVTAIVPSSVIRELQMLMKKGDWRIKAALELAKKYPIVDIKGKGDAPIFNLAVKKGWMVMTQDKRLRTNLMNRGISVIILRGRGHFQIMEP